MDKALDGTNPTTGGFVLAKGTKDDMKAFVTAAKATDGSIIAAAKKVSLLSITEETYKSTVLKLKKLLLSKSWKRKVCSGYCKHCKCTLYRS